MMLPRWLLLGFCFGYCQCAMAQQNAEPLAKYRLLVTIRLQADKQPLTRLTATCPVPAEWPEQTVTLLEESKPVGSKSREQTITGMGKLWVVEIPRLAPGQTVELERVYEITRREVRLPVEINKLNRPQKLPVELRGSLQSSPKIEITDPALRQFSQELSQEHKSPQAFTQAAATWVGKHIRYEQGAYRGAKFAFENRVGDCEDLSALFIALCRIAEIPARTVWVEGHAYPEFYLEDNRQQGYWIPVQLHGQEAFGTIRETRPILQKGDRYRDPKTRQVVRYLPQQAIAFGGAAHMAVHWTTVTDPSTAQ